MMYTNKELSYLAYVTKKTPYALSVRAAFNNQIALNYTLLTEIPDTAPIAELIIHDAVFDVDTHFLAEKLQAKTYTYTRFGMLPMHYMVTSNHVIFSEDITFNPDSTAKDIYTINELKDNIIDGFGRLLNTHATLAKEIYMLIAQ